MVDNMTVLLENYMPGEAYTETGPFEYEGLLFVPVHNKTDGALKCFDARLDNLIVRLIPGLDRCYIINSIHKYYLGNNHSDFHLSQMEAAFEQLSDRLKVDVSAGIIKKIEYGCNIEIADIKVPLTGLEAFRGASYQPMLKGKTKYGTKCAFDQYMIKGYDKAYQVKATGGGPIKNGLFRWEIRVNRMAALHKRKVPIPIETISDLLEYEKLQYLCHDLVEKYQDSLKRLVISPGTLSLREKTAYSRMTTPAICEDLKSNYKATYKEDMRLYKAILSKSSCADHETISRLLTQKCADLLNG